MTDETSVDGRPNSRNIVAYSNSFSVVYAIPNILRATRPVFSVITPHGALLGRCKNVR